MILYNARMTVTEEGLGVWYEKWHAIYETGCFYMCLQDWQMTGYSGLSDSEIKERCKSQGRKLKRITKQGSRFAHKNKADALDSLMIKKNAQIAHCRRNLAVVSEFVNRVDADRDSLLLDDNLIEGTKDLVSEWYIFD